MHTVTEKIRKLSTGTAGVLFTALVSVGGFAAGAPSAHATTPGPFACQPGFYQVASGQLKLLNPVTKTYTDVGAVYSDQYNAIGFNRNDNYIYGIGSTGATRGHLLKIANNGSVTDLGVPTGEFVTQGYYTGDFDDDGNLIVRASDADTYYSINVTTKVSTKITVAAGSAANGSDAVLIGDVLYSVDGTSLYAFDLDTKDVATTSITWPAAPADPTFGATWADADDNLYVSNNESGKIFKISGYDGANPEAVEMLEGPVVPNGSYNDGTSCKTANAPFDPPTATSDAYQAVAGATLTIAAVDGILKNDDGSALVLDSVTVQPAHGTVVVNANGSFSYVPAPGFSGDDSFKYKAKDQWGRVTNEVTVSLVVKPLAVDDVYTFLSDGKALTTTDGEEVIENDLGTNVTVIANTLPGHGAVTVDANGVMTYKPEAGYSGKDSFTYTIRDAAGRTSTATVTVDVKANPAVKGASVTASGGTLAATGGRVESLTILGFISMIGGAALVLFARRRIAA